MYLYNISSFWERNWEILREDVVLLFIFSFSVEIDIKYTEESTNFFDSDIKDRYSVSLLVFALYSWFIFKDK